MAEKARLIITLDCNRDCADCCNKSTRIMSSAKRVTELDFLTGYKQLLITGGEPMLYPVRIARIVGLARRVNPEITIYVYTAVWTDEFVQIGRMVDGINFTIHEDSTPEERQNLCAVQGEIQAAWAKDKSWRLKIHRDLAGAITILPSLWKEIRIRPWLPMGSLKVPDNEDLFILEGQGDD